MASTTIIVAWRTQKKSNCPTFPTLKTRTGKSAIKPAMEPKPTGTNRGRRSRRSRRSPETPAVATTATTSDASPRAEASSRARPSTSLTDDSITSDVTWSVTACGTLSPVASSQSPDLVADRRGRRTARDPSRQSGTLTGGSQFRPPTTRPTGTSRRPANILHSHPNIPDRRRLIVIAIINTRDHHRLMFPRGGVGVDTKSTRFVRHHHQSTVKRSNFLFFIVFQAPARSQRSERSTNRKTISGSTRNLAQSPSGGRPRRRRSRRSRCEACRRRRDRF